MSIINWLVSNAIAVGTPIIAIAIAYRVFRYNRQTLENQNYLELFKEHGSVQMFAAISRLYILKLHCEEEEPRTPIKDGYDKTRAEEEKQEERIEYSKKVEYIENTLHFQRRVVSKFYMALGHGLDLNVLPEERTLGSWGQIEMVKIILDLKMDGDATLKRLYERLKIRKKRILIRKILQRIKEEHPKTKDECLKIRRKRLRIKDKCLGIKNRRLKIREKQLRIRDGFLGIETVWLRIRDYCLNKREKWLRIRDGCLKKREKRLKDRDGCLNKREPFYELYVRILASDWYYGT